MKLPVASVSTKEAAARSPDYSHQSVFDWASPDEERDNPKKVDEFGYPLASFHELRTRESNKEPGNWTVEHAIHVARWEFHQAGYTLTQLGESSFRMQNDELEDIIEILRFMPLKFDPECLSFAQASARVVSFLEKTAHLAVETMSNKTSLTETACRVYPCVLPTMNLFLAAKFSLPTGALPESLLQNLKTLDSSDYLELEATQKKATSLTKRKTILKVGDDAEHQAEKDANQSLDAAPSKNMSFDSGSSQVLINRTINDRDQKSKDSKHDKKHKLSDDHLDVTFEAAVEKKLAPYEVLLDDYAELADLLVQCLNRFSDLREKAAQLKQRRAELKAAAAPNHHSSKTRS
ncbi:hypothetical protein G3M48_008112 [Beauveria asiatica]|uniref:Uncharacterized protein n=1 Tax=Beauveria asiatica TaxID=1069075 RepID=A0AAW0S8W0_9HYPO